jgi:hypothetical protein
VVGTNLIGDLPGYPTPVWYHPKGIANILSLKRVSQHCRVQYDSEENAASFHVTKPDGTVLDFKPSISGLHYCDSRVYGTSLINTVAEKKSQYTRRACKKAMLARRIQNVIGRPSTRDFIKIVKGGMLRNCPVSRSDVMTAEDIFRPNLGSLKGKTVRSKNAHVPSLVADVPYHIIKLHKDVTLCFDIMFVNKIAFLTTVSRNLRFGTTERLPSRHAGVVGKALVNVISLYRKRGFRIRECHGDGEFESLRATLADAQSSLNVTAEDEHVPEIERYIRTIKERTRCVYNIVPFKRMPGLMIVELVHSSNFWLNMFPANDGVSAVQSPRRILTGQTGDYALHCQLEFGEYAQVHESQDNSMLTRTTGAIALRPTGNIQGGYYFMSLTSGKRLTRYAWTPLPMPGEVIERVHVLSQRNPAGSDIVFGWRNGQAIDDELGDSDDLHDEDYIPGQDDSYSDTDDDSTSYTDDDAGQASVPPPVAGVNNENLEEDANNENLEEHTESESEYADDHDEYDVPGEVTDEDTDEEHNGVKQEEHDDVEQEQDTETNDDSGSEAGVHSDKDDHSGGEAGVPTAKEGVPSAKEGVPSAKEGVPSAKEGVPSTASMTAKYGPRRRAGMRKRKPPRTAAQVKEPHSSAHHAPTSMLEHELCSMSGFTDLEHVALTQYNVKRGLQLYGQAASDAVLKEMKQLHDRKTIRPRASKDLTRQEKCRALAYLMFIKEKRCGTIKARGCADGRKQRLYKGKEETSAPTVRTESLMLSCVIDAKERRKVMTCDVPGAFMHLKPQDRGYLVSHGLNTHYHQYPPCPAPK